MALPANATAVTVTAQHTNPDGTPAVGQVKCNSTQNVVGASAKVILTPGHIRATLDNTGSLAVTLAATNDPDLAPLNWTWQVQEVIQGINA